MTYSEEEIQKYLSILQNFKDGLNVYSSVKDDHIPPKLQKRFHVKIVVILIFSKMVVSVTVTIFFILLVVFLSKKQLSKIDVVSDRNVFTRESIIIKIK